MISTRRTVARLGGRPLFDTPLRIVRPSFPTSREILEAFRVTLASGHVTNGGPAVVEFERQLTNFLDVETLAFCNGQTALMTMIRAAGIHHGEVIVPSFTFAATAHAVRWCGAEPVFADILDDGSFRIDPADVVQRITNRTVAILGVDPYGISCDYASLDEIGRRHGLKVLYDSAAAFGTRYDGAELGHHGDAQIFSFHATKALACMEGGALSSRDPEILKRARAIRNFGQEADADCNEAGLNGKMNEITALVGLAQLSVFPDARAARLERAKQMQRGLQGIPGISAGRAPYNQQPIWLYLPIVIDAPIFGLTAQEVSGALEQENIFVRRYYSPACHLLKCYCTSSPSNLPVTETISPGVIALPVHNDMSESECERVVQAVADIHLASSQITDF